jgi:hypothetical protein
MLARSATVRLDDSGIPERFEWDGISYRVTDTPTPLNFDFNFVTHVPTLPTGWRFQGTNDAMISLVFDVASFDQGNTWRVLHTYQ